MLLPIDITASLRMPRLVAPLGSAPSADNASRVSLEPIQIAYTASDGALPPKSAKNMLIWVPRSNSGKSGAFARARARPTA